MRSHQIVAIGILAGAPVFGPVAPSTAGITVDLSTTTGDGVIWGRATERLGFVATVGDLNGDGLADVVFYGTDSLTAKQRVCIYFGPFSFPLVHDSATETPPSCITDVSVTSGCLRSADLDGDGVEDLILGLNYSISATRSSTGMVAIFRGRPSWPATLALSDADWTFVGADSGDSLSSAAVGDLNGDGQPDIALFAPWAGGPGNSRPGAGEGYIFFGPPIRWPRVNLDLSVDRPDVTIYGVDGSSLTPPSNGDGLGAFEGLAIADLLDDAIPDLVAAASGAAGPLNDRPNAGEVYVLHGRKTWPTTIDLRTPGAADLVVYGPAVSSTLGVPRLGDWNGDGRADLLMGAPQHDDSRSANPRTGAVFILLAPVGTGTRDLNSIAADETIVGASTDGNFGGAIGLGDFDGDGALDVLVGANFDATRFSRPAAGAVYLLSGCAGVETFRDLGVKAADMAIYGAHSFGSFPLTGDHWGSSVSLGDMNQDGRADVLATAPQSASLASARGAGAGEARVILGRQFDAPCVVTADAGGAITSCGSTPVTLDGAASTVSGCALAPEYRWSLGPAVLCSWSASPRCSLAATSGTYRLDVRCGDCSSGMCTGSATATVTIDPDLVPGNLGDTLRAVRTGGAVELTWGGDPLARSYSLYRGDTKGAWPPPLQTLLAAPRSTLPDVPSPPSLYFYRVAGASCSGREGP